MVTDSGLRYSSTAGPARFAARAARVFTAEPGAPVIEQGVVMVSGGRIEAVGHVTDFALEGVTVVDLGDATLLPGLIDAHTHISLDVLAGNEAIQAAMIVATSAG